MSTAGERRFRYSCRNCGDGLTREDLKTGRAVIRSGGTYCRKCHGELFPKDCPNHPEVAATGRCSRCRMRFCEDCLVELQGKTVCARCKQRVLSELIVGPAKPRSGRRTRRQPPSAVLAAGILGFFCCGGFAILALWGYYNHRKDVADGVAKPSKMAGAGFIFGLFWLALLLIGLLTGKLAEIL